MRSDTRLHDEHVHTRPHGASPPAAHRLAPMLEAYAARGIVPGIREHAPLPARYRLGPDGDYLFGMRIEEVDAFLGELEGTGVAVGFEVDHIDGHVTETRAIVADLLDRARARGIPIGGLTGSVHFIEGTVADLDPLPDKGGVPHILCDYLERIMQAHLAERGAEATVRGYFASVRNLISTGLYDTVGHIELVRKWDRRDSSGRSTLFAHVEELYSAELETTLRLAAEADVLVEYNTAGRDTVIGRPYLSDDAVRACVRHGVRLALSSDAHAPRDAGRYLAETARALPRLGVSEVCAVRDRKRIVIRL